jgi:Cof subfamily protein (haloacid dehalogenase superfamily)
VSSSGTHEPRPEVLPRLVAIDLDGTLLGGDGQISLRSITALAALAAHGVHVVIATGRPPMMLGELVAATGSSIGYVVGSNGSMISRLPGPELLRLVGFDLELARTAIISLRAADHRFGFALATDAGFAHEPGFAERMPAAIGTDAHPDVLSLGGTEAFKLMVFHPETDARQLVLELPAMIGDRLAVNHMGADAAEIGPVDLDKCAGLVWLCEHLGIEAAQVIAFGDDWNDLTMLQWAGHGVAMANADERVRLLADEIAPSHRDDGVAVVIERLLEQFSSETPGP